MFVNKYKHKVFIQVALPVIVIMLLASCKQHKEDSAIERSFYYWKSVFKITAPEQGQLNALQVKTLYVKFFDVDWDDATKQPLPKAVIRFADTSYKAFHIIPTVFITNECIQKIDTAQTEAAAVKITGLIRQIILSNSFKEIHEVQIDCDWTANTKEKYFTHLRHIKKLQPTTDLSVTIRLHQVKFYAKTGIPPADRGLLMCYNMGNLKNPATTNSILEVQELKKYIGHLSSYPLDLDVALPLFDWKVLFRNNVYSGLIENLPDTVFTNLFITKQDNRYQFLKDTLLQGYDFKKGDILRNEKPAYAEIIDAATAINKRLKNTRLRVSLYHLDAVILKKYSPNELEAIYNSMR